MHHGKEIPRLQVTDSAPVAALMAASARAPTAAKNAVNAAIFAVRFFDRAGAEGSGDN